MPKTTKDKADRTESLQRFKLYTLKELEPVLGMSHRTLLEYVTTGKLKAVKVGGKWRVSEDNLQRFVNGE